MREMYRALSSCDYLWYSLLSSLLSIYALETQYMAYHPKVDSTNIIAKRGKSLIETSPCLSDMKDLKPAENDVIFIIYFITSNY